jgi:hypothetical protein
MGMVRTNTVAFKSALVYLGCATLYCGASMLQVEPIFTVPMIAVLGAVPFFVGIFTGFSAIHPLIFLALSSLFGFGLGWIVQQVEDVTDRTRVRFVILLGAANSAPVLCFLFIVSSFTGS